MVSVVSLMNSLKDVKEPRKQRSWVTWSKMKIPPLKNTSQNVTEKELTTGKGQRNISISIWSSNSEVITISEVVTSKGHEYFYFYLR